METLRRMTGIKANARIQEEQDVDETEKSLNLKLLGQRHDEVLLATDGRYKHYKAIDDSIILKHGPLFRIYYEETGSVNYYQVLITKQLVEPTP